MDKKLSLNDQYALTKLNQPSDTPGVFNSIADALISAFQGIGSAGQKAAEAYSGDLTGALYPNEAQPIAPDIQTQEQDASKYLQELIARNQNIKANKKQQEVAARADILNQLVASSKPGTLSYTARGNDVQGLGQIASKGSYSKMKNTSEAEDIMSQLVKDPELKALMGATRSAKSEQDKFLTNQLWQLYTQKQQAEQGKNDAFLAALGSKNEDSLAILKALLRARGAKDMDIERFFSDTTKKK